MFSQTPRAGNIHQNTIAIWAPPQNHAAAVSRMASPWSDITCEAPGTYRHILVATDGAELTDQSIATGLTLANRLRAKATVVTTSRVWPAARTCHGSAATPFVAHEKGVGAMTLKMPESVRELARRLGIECAMIHINSAEEILKVATDRGCDIIVMASNRRCEFRVPLLLPRDVPYPPADPVSQIVPSSGARHESQR